MLKNFVSLLALFLFAPITPLVAQCLTMSDGIRPSWVNNSRHRPQATNRSVFITIFVEGQTLDDVRRKAETELNMARGRAAGEWIKTQGGNMNRADAEFQVKAQCLGEHIECGAGRYRLWQLVQIARTPDQPSLESISARNISNLEKNTLGLKPFIPGMAQIHKGSNAKGVFFIVGTSVFVGGIVATEVFRADNVSKVNTTFNVEQRRTYINNANTLQNWRNISIAATGAIYAWNVIDGFAGRKSNTCGNRWAQTRDSDFRITPYADLHGTGGVILSWGF